MAAPTVLVVSRVSPLSGGSGFAAYTADVIEKLVRCGFTVNCLVTDTTGPAWIKLPKACQGRVKLIDDSYIHVGRYIFSVKKLVKRLFAKIRLRVAPRVLPTIRLNTEELSTSEIGSTEAKRVKNAYAHTRPQLIVMTYSWMAPVLSQLDDTERTLKAVLAPDVWHKKSEDFSRAGIANFNVDYETERTQLSHADVVLAISEADAGVFRGMLPGKKVIVLPPMPEKRQVSGTSVRGRVIFAGSSYVANVQGLQWFFTYVWPLVLHQCPWASLHVVGGVCEKIDNVPPGVRSVGYVIDIGQEYAAAELAVVPLLCGSGVKIKLIEALSYGTPCVSTEVGVQGIEFLIPHGLRVGRSAEEFAQHMVAILTGVEGGRSLAVAAWSELRRRWSFERCYGELLEVYRERGGHPAGSIAVCDGSLETS